MSSFEDDLVNRARNLIGVAKWKYAAKPHQAPEMVDCSSLTQWLYATVGVSIPRRSYKQMRMVTRRNGLDDACVADLLFVSSPYVAGVKTLEHKGLHVCLVVSRSSVVCATNSELGNGVVEISIEDVLKTRSFLAVGKP